MFIEFDNGEIDKTWNINETLNSNISINHISSIVVYGEELNFIREHFRLPIDVPNSKCIKWRGDHAKFIIENFQELLKN